MIPFSKPENDGGAEDMLQDFHIEHVKSVRFRQTKMGQFTNFTSFAVTYTRKGDAPDVLQVDEAQYRTEQGIEN